MSKMNRELTKYEATPLASAPAGTMSLAPPMPQENLLHIALHRRWTVLAVMLLALGAGAAYLAYATPVYTSTARLYVSQTTPPLLGADAARPWERPENFLQTQCQVITSVPILMEAIDSAQVKQMKSFAKVESDLVGTLQGTIIAGVGKRDDIISLWADTHYPEDGTQLLKAVVDAYINFHSKARQSTATEMLRLLHKEREQLAAEQKAKVAEMVAFQQKHGTLSFDSDRGNILLGQLSRLSEQLTTARLNRVEAQAAYEAAKVATSNPEALQQFIESQMSRNAAWSDREYQDLRDQLQRLQMNLSLLHGRMLSNHPVLQATQQAVAQTQARIAEKQSRFAKAYLAGLDQQRVEAQNVEAGLRQAFDEQQKQALSLSTQAAEYTRLKSDLERVEKAGDVLIARIKELSASQGAGALNISVIEPPHATLLPTKPKKRTVLSMALVAGLILGLMAAFLRDRRDLSFRSGEEIKALLGMPALYIVPHISGRHWMVARGQIVHLEPASEAAEAYRVIRTAVCFAMKGKKGKKILIASPSLGDGKTTAASNLALALAQAGLRTLLVDADMRRPMLHNIYQVKRQIGLSSVLGGKASLEEAVVPTGVEFLDLLPAGPIAPNPSEMLSSPAFAQTLETLSGKYDYIVIDSPPVVAVADARILAAACDATLLVLRAGKSDRHLSNSACEALLDVGARILGVIANDVTRQLSRAGYSYGNYSYRAQSSASAPSADSGEAEVLAVKVSDESEAPQRP